ncbi:Eukaryotic translation initiation factor 3 subunit C, partial [Operophtera brumata]
FSDDEEETKRVVRSMKEKRYEELEGIIHSLRNHKKIKDFSSALASFEELQKAYTKAAAIIAKEESGVAPRFFIRALTELDDWVAQAWTDRDSRKALSKGNSKALTSLRQKLRKYEKDFDAEISKFREDPDQPDDEDDERKVDDEEKDKRRSKRREEKKERAGHKSSKRDQPDDGGEWETVTKGGATSDKPKMFAKVHSTLWYYIAGHKSSKRDQPDDGGEWETVTKGGATSDKPKMFAKVHSTLWYYIAGHKSSKRDQPDDGGERETVTKGGATSDKPKMFAKSSKRDQPDDGGEWETVTKGGATSDKPKMFAKVHSTLWYYIAGHKSSKRDQPDDGGEWETVTKGGATSDKPKMFAKLVTSHRSATSATTAASGKPSPREVPRLTSLRCSLRYIPLCGTIAGHKSSKRDQRDDGGEWETITKGGATSDKSKMFAKLVTSHRSATSATTAASGKPSPREVPRLTSLRCSLRYIPLCGTIAGHKSSKRDQRDDGGEWETVTKRGATSDKSKMFAKKLGEISAARGRKRTDRRAQLELLHELRTVALAHTLGDALQLKLRAAIVASLFDYNPKVSDAMKPEYWSRLVENVDHMVTLILAHDDMILSEAFTEDNEELITAPFKVRGCVLTSLERLDDEFTKLLKECDPHSNEYVERLKDEVRVSALIDRVCLVVERDGTPQEICRAYLRKIDHLYYKFDPRAVRKDLPPGEETTIKKMERLCKYIYAHDDSDRLRTRAILSHIYHHALHDNWFQARDLLLMSHLQETVQHSDPSTQILYNRTMANLGLCAFRRGNVKEAHGCLAELMMTGKPKELLAQGLLPQRQHERSKEQEKIEKQRQMPFHMHINLELLECVYLVSAMMIEIPYMAAHEFDARRRMISKTFYQNLRANNVRAMLGRLIREESLRTYLFTYAHVYASLSLRSLADMFELPRQRVHSLVSKMIINEELLASLDDPSDKPLKFVLEESPALGTAYLIMYL